MEESHAHIRESAWFTLTLVSKFMAICMHRCLNSELYLAITDFELKYMEMWEIVDLAMGYELDNGGLHRMDSWMT